MPNKPTHQKLSSELEAISNEIVETYFALKLFGEEIGLIHDLGNNVSTILGLLLDHGRMSLSEVARIRGVSRQYAVRLARKLEEEGSVRVEHTPGRRGYHLTLTPRGIEQVRARGALFRERLSNRLAMVDLDRLAVARTTLSDFRTALGANGPDEENF